MNNVVVGFPERPFARFLQIEEHVWEDTNEPVWVVYLDNEATGEPRELKLCDSLQGARQFADSWSPDRDLFGSLLPMPEEDESF